ncbi:glycoside hydrolase family 16 protein [Novosphingobium profundi]|uniref:glycoside hydrolase family 16 protein n=1 Tax=Novosphingobium profundi TaxID=1774954 RepID=UPI001BDB5031|nr:glycoside hydrolase family 16 protein [Novosphingobium profundi]MBT0668687.1 glycoside hydrolase family 16 protein [Novosphingobium profundi]
MRGVRGPRRPRVRLGGTLALLLVVAGDGGALPTGAVTPPQLGAKLDISRYRITFAEPFEALDVSAWGPGTRWIAHTPWAGDFGDAVFLDPRDGVPFTVKNGVLRITMRQRDGRWESGLLCASDSRSQGFLQSGGYFEVRARLPDGPGVWPAFWLGSNADGVHPNPEIDVLEYYGRFPGAYLATTHVWKDGKSIGGSSYRVDVPAHSLETGFHTYGVSIDAAFVTFYLDRKVVAYEATRPEYLQRLYPMVNLAAGGGWPIQGMKNPSVMYVDYIKVFTLKEA